jgi:XRE family transcriptional regulator, regulator of sulfur utilization
MITRRDVFVALITITVTVCIVGARSQPPVMQSSLFDWNAVPVKPTEVGAVRQFFRAPTATLEELECHVTTLNPGMASHPPHKHPNEELIVVKEGLVEVLVNGELKKAGPGSVIFNASNQLHGIKNVGTGPATYHVFNWRSAAKTAQP